MTSIVEISQPTYVVSVSDNTPDIAVTLTDQLVTVSVGLIATAGGGGGPVRFETTFSSASMLWVVNHNLGFRPNVSTVTLGGFAFQSSIEHLSANALNVRHNSALAGTVICS